MRHTLQPTKKNLERGCRLGVNFRKEENISVDNGHDDEEAGRDFKEEMTTKMFVLVMSVER